MISDKQLIANKKNGQLGGVKSVNGKETSKYNALKHGLLRHTLTDYEKECYLEIYADFVNEYQPVTIFEKVLVERAVIYYIKLFRLQRAENEYMKTQLDPKVFEYDTDIKDIFKGRILNEGYSAQITDQNIQKLADVYMRYEIAIENRLYRAIHELERAIATRKGERLPMFNIFQMGSFRKNSMEVVEKSY